MSILRSKLENLQKWVEETIEGLDLTIKVKKISIAENKAVAKEMKRLGIKEDGSGDTSALSFYIMSKFIQDEEGAPLVTDCEEDRKMIDELPAATAMEILAAYKRINAIAEDEDAAKKE